MNKRVRLDTIPEPPPPRPLHWVYYLLYEFGLVAGLWQHGHPYFTIALLSALPFFSVAVYLPFRVLSAVARSALQHLCGVIAIVWIIFRVQNSTPLDLLLVEGFAVMGAGFAFSTVAKSYGFVLLMSLMLFGYGALLPPRELFVLVLGPGLALFFLLLYQSRVTGLSQGASVPTEQTVKLANWRPILLHALLAGLILPLLVSVLPRKDTARTPGMVASSFSARDSLNLAPKFSQWFRTPNVRRSATGSTWTEGQNPTEFSKEARTRVPDGEGEGSMSANGSGAAPPGKDLVMQVRSKSKLYWLGRLYDEYDGENWSASSEMTDQRINNRVGFNEEVSPNVVSQTFVVEKWVSPQLFAAYMPRMYVMTGSVQVRSQRKFPIDRLAAEQDYPRLPFTYEAESIIGVVPPSASDTAADDDTDARPPRRNGDPARPRNNQHRDSNWIERLPQKHYLQLPEGQISPRLRSLALSLTKSSTEPLDKAMALRDYLRNSFDYTETPKPSPPGREPVDYFLFEMKEGHCQYFAASLCLLARLNGLPARVATGFSPGNYNTLTGMFEVYEYHAHAWAQIYVENYGWLTMDGTPAAARQLQLRTTPLMFGSLRDPFSDDWRITTPELSERMDSTAAAEANASATPAGESGGLRTALSKLFGLDAPVETLPSDPEVRPMDAQEVKEIQEAEHLPVDAGILETIKFNLRQLYRNIRTRFLAMAEVLALHHLMILIGLCLVVIFLLLKLPDWLARWRFNRRMRQCEKWYNLAETQCDSDPRACIMNCYRCIRELLMLCERPRLRNQDLYAYGISLQDFHAVLGQDALTIFNAYSRMRYSEEGGAPRDAKTTLERTRDARSVLRDMLNIA